MSKTNKFMWTGIVGKQANYVTQIGHKETLNIN